MRKKNLLAGIYNVYAIYDKVSKHYLDLYYASTDEDFVRTKLPTAVLTCALRDMTVYKIGIFNDVTGEIKPSVKKILKTDCYYFPHSRLSPPGENISIEDVEKAVTETKNEIIAKNSSPSEEENKEEVKENE